MDLTPIQPVAAIIGALITAGIASAVTFFVVVKRKVVTFWVAPTIELTGEMKKQHERISFKIDDKEFRDLHRAQVSVRNTGNAAISNFCFDILIPGEHNS